MNQISTAISCFVLASSAAGSTLPSPAELILNFSPAMAEEAEASVDAAAEEKSPWKGSFGLGFTASKTTTNTVGLNMNGALSRTDAMSTWASSLKYVYNVDDKVVQDNFLVAQSNYDRLWAIDSPWSWFLNASYQFNQTESYRQRVKGFGGAGYYFSRTDDLSWNGRAGAGTSWDEHGTQQGWTPRALFSTNATWKPIEGMNFEGTASYEPAFTDFNNYLAILEMKVNLAVSAVDNLSIYFTLRNEYNSRPGEGDSYNQIWVTLGFAYGF